MNEVSEFIHLLRERFSVAGEVSIGQAERLWRHFDLLSRWNRVINLSGIRSMDEAIVRHYCESLFLARHLPGKPVSALDVGSGAGFPGIPMAVARPDCEFTLAESHARKAAFLSEATRDLKNVKVVAARAECLGGGFDWVVCRAVAWSEVRRYGGRLGSSLALLVSAADAEKIGAAPEWVWSAPIELPWSRASVLLIGSARST